MKTKLIDLPLWDGKTDVYIRHRHWPIECAGEIEYPVSSNYDDVSSTIIDAVSRKGKQYFLHHDFRLGYRKIILSKEIT